MAIAACFALQREICSSVLLAFFDSIGQTGEELSVNKCLLSYL